MKKSSASSKPSSPKRVRYDNMSEDEVRSRLIGIARQSALGFPKISEVKKLMPGLNKRVGVFGGLQFILDLIGDEFKKICRYCGRLTSLSSLFRPESFSRHPWACLDCMSKDFKRRGYKEALCYSMVHAKARAKKKGLPYDLDLDFLKELYTSQDGKCLLTGISFMIDTESSRSGPNRFSVSLDRITPSDGYVKSNVRLVVWSINMAMGSWGEDTYKYVAEKYLERHHGSKEG